MKRKLRVLPPPVRSFTFNSKGLTMYKIDFGYGIFKQTKYFLAHAEAVEYCGYFKWSTKRIKSVH